jgi:peptide/nickel transport system substrate-binding protein
MHVVGSTGAARISRPRRRSATLLIAALVTALAVTGCADSQNSASSDGDGRAAVGDAVTFGTSAAPPSLNPAISDPAYGSVLQWAYDPLVVMNAEGEFEPGLATEWGYVGEGNTTYEFTLREGLKFSDGTPLDAAAAKTYFEYAKAQKSGTAPTLLASIESIETPEPLKVRLNLNRPDPTMTFNFAQAFGGGYMASPKAIGDPKSLDFGTAGTGPYMLDVANSVPNDRYEFVQNPNYWNKDRQHWKSVTVRVITNPSSMVQAMQAGQVQAALGDATTLEAARSAGLEVIAPPQALSGLNLMDRGGKLSKPLSDQRVRQALNLAVDRDAIAQALYGDEDLALAQFALEGQAPHDASLDDQYEFDVDEAKALMAEAGYAEGFTLQVVSTPLFGLDKLVQAIGGQLSDNIGVKIDLQSKPDANGYFTSMVSGEAPAAALAYGLANMGSLWAGYVNPAGPFNPFKTTDAELDALYQEYFAADPRNNTDVQQKINARLMELGWALPVVGAPLSYYQTDAVTGLEDATSANAGVPWLTDLRPAS